MNDKPVAAPAVGDGGTGRRLWQWETGQSVEGLDPSRGKRPGVRTLMLRSVRSPLALRWNMTRTVHPTFMMTRGSAAVGPDGEGETSLQGRRGPARASDGGMCCSGPRLPAGTCGQMGAWSQLSLFLYLTQPE